MKIIKLDRKLKGNFNNKPIFISSFIIGLTGAYINGSSSGKSMIEDLLYINSSFIDDYEKPQYLYKFI